MSESLILTAAKTEDLDEAVRAAIIQLCVAAHQEEDFKNLFTYIPSGGLHFLAYHDQAVVSHAMVTTRWLQPQGLPLLKTAYVDAVGTLPTHQGLGYASAIMRRLADEIDCDYDVASLETDKTGFYERLGWQTWRGPLAGRSEQGLVPTPEQRGIMILQLAKTPSLDLDSLLTIECQTGRIW